MLDTVTDLAAQAGSRLDVTDERATGTGQDFTCTAALTAVQRDAVTERGLLVSACWSPRPEPGRP